MKVTDKKSCSGKSNQPNGDAPHDVKIPRSLTYQVQDGAQVGILPNDIRKKLELDMWRHHTDYELILLEYLKMIKVSIDMITQYSIHPT